MSLKILGGSYKNIPLKSPSSKLTKPTTSLMRKAVFDICQGYIQEANFLDLFACSGAMGLEALSRGAAFSTFIEKDRKTARTLKENITKLKLEESTFVIIGDVFTALSRLIKQEKSYDIIYIDPPYPLFHDKTKPIEKLLAQIDSSSLLKEGGTLFLEEGSPSSFEKSSPLLQNIEKKNSRKFGDSYLHQFINR